MAGSSLLSPFRKRSGFPAILVAAFALAGCGQGDGPEGIQNTAVTPLPPVPPGFCDPVNFEPVCPQPGIVNFNGGATVVVDNPDASGINESATVARMQKFGDQVFGGTRLDPIDIPVDFAAGEVFKLNVWSEREVPVTFKLEETTVGVDGVERVQTHTGGSTWQELCYDFSGSTPTTIALTVIFDNGVLGQAIAGVFEGDWTFYYDDITQVESCTGSGASPIDPDVALYRTSGDADLVIPDDYSEVTPFGSGSVINDMFADDQTFSPVLAISSGTGYGANVAQVGYIGFDAGFLTNYESVVFKARGLPDSVILVKLFDGADTRRISLTSSSFAEELEDGWFQVSIPVSTFNNTTTATGIVFESDDTAPMPFTMLLTDIGFGDNGGGGPPPPPSTTLGVFSETNTNPAVVITDVVQAGNPVTIDTASTAVTPFDGSVSLELMYSDNTAGNGFGGAIFEFDDEDLSAFDTLTFSIDTSAFANFANLTVQLEPPGGGTPGGNVSLATYTPVSMTGNWNVYEIPLADFTAVTPTQVNRLGFFNARDGSDTLIAGTLYLDDIHFTTVGGGGGGGGGGSPGAAVNGDFETGDFTGWTVFLNSGVQSISSDTPANGGSFSAALSANTAPGLAGTTEIKQANIGAGTLNLGDVVSVSFDVKGTFGPAGQLNVLNFTELSGGGGTLSNEVTITSASGVDDWTSFNYDVTLNGPDAGGGFSLAFNPVCGAVDGCFADVFIDNVSITIN